MLTVLAAWWGTWGDGHAAAYVRRLRAGVARHLREPHRFVLACEYARDIWSPPPYWLMDVPLIPLPDRGLAGEMRRMWLLSREAPLEGRVLLLDLDTLITGPLDAFAAYRGQFAVLDDLHTPGVCGGGIIGYEARDPVLHERLWLPAIRNVTETNSFTGGGDERHWFRRMMPHADRWQRIAPGKVTSAWRLYAKNGSPARELIPAVPQGVSAVCFHGQPRMHEVSAPWIEEHWRE